MFEMTISTSKAKSKDISFILNKLRPDFKAMKGIMVCEEIDKRVKLALAVSKDKKDLAISLIFDAVSEAIIRDYKEEYLLKNLKINLPNKITLSAFVKALTMFDKINDKEIIKKKLVLTDELHLDSFYNFRLWELEKRWQEIAQLVTENSGYLLASGSFMELMRFLIMTNDAEFGELHVYYDNEHIIAKNKEGREVFNIKYVKEDVNSKINVISEIISLSPQKIILHNDMFDNELYEYIENLFDGKVSVLK